MQDRKMNRFLIHGQLIAMVNQQQIRLDVNALLPISGPKGYGLMMMVDVLSGILTWTSIWKQSIFYVRRFNGIP